MMKNFLRKLWDLLGAKGTALLVLLLFSALVLYQNTLDTVEIDILFWDAVTVSKVTFIAFCLLFGGIVGFFFGWRFRGRSRSADF